LRGDCLTIGAGRTASEVLDMKRGRHRFSLAKPPMSASARSARTGRFHW
jgi:hypothetical protein